MKRLSHRLSKTLQYTLAVCLGLALTACGGSSSPTVQPKQALGGRTSFVSADRIGALPTEGAINKGNIDIPAVLVATPTSADAAQQRSVQEGDIYRVLESGKSILNLNMYRGLQIIDISNPAKPTIVGRAAISGNPVEMYHSGDKVYILLNDWSQFRRTIKGGKESVEQFQGGGVITVDIANRAAPVVVGSTRVPGYIQTSRLTSGAGKHALYVTSSEFAMSTPVAAAVGTGVVSVTSGQANVLSYAINAQGLLESKSTLSLGGHVQAMQATGNRLMVARAVEGGGKHGSRVSVVDISSPDGTMVQGADVLVSGMVQKKTNMHIHGDVLRVVSGNWWNTGSNVNHVETFDIADIAKPKAIDHDTFGEGQQLFGTSFSADKAFFVTYLRQDPFHAFSITPEGMMKEENEFIVSGWNDFFVPVHKETRLIGVGHNDENNRRSLAISLYDTTNLKNTRPLLMRAEVDLSHSWSEANWDDRAFSVLENATKATAADGKTVETGLVLLPFSGHDSATGQGVGGVQIFTFSATTLTRRGTMKQETGVRRSFLGDAANSIAANLSESDLSLFSILNPDAPQEKGSVRLAPNYSQFIAFKQVGARYHSVSQAWSGSGTARRMDQVELVPLAGADGPTILSHIEVPAGSKIHNVGEKLVVVSSDATPTGVNSTIVTYDVSASAKPVKIGSLTTDALVQSGGGIYYAGDMAVCMYSGRSCWGGFFAPEATVVGNALVFAGHTHHAPTSGGALVNRYWTSYTLQVLDLSNPAKPALLAKMSMPDDEESVGMVKSGTTLWINYKKPQAGSVAEQPQAKYYIKALDLSVAGAPRLGAEVNVPGQLMAVVGEAIYTVDHDWKEKSASASLNMLIVRDNLAYLQATHPMPGQVPTGLLVDGKNVFVAHYGSSSYQGTMSHFEVGAQQFAAKSETALPYYPTLRAVRNGKVLVQAGYGFLLYDFTQPQGPFAQAYFQAMNWNGGVTIVDDAVYVPSGSYGIYQFTLDTVNLQKP
jgi:hypothetical protein